MKDNHNILKSIYLFILFLFTSQAVYTQTNWTIQNSKTSSDLNDVFFINQDTGWVCGDNGIILKTTDGGTNWHRKTSGTQETLRGIFFSSQTSGWICGYNGTMLHTNDGGDHWQSQEIDTDQFLWAVYFQTDRIGWTCDLNGSVFRTTDSGNTWIKSTVNGNAWLLHALGFWDEDNGWGIEMRGIIKTTDGGITWNYSEANNIGMTNHSGFFINEKIGWVTGSGGSFKTMDGGLSWSEMETYGGNDIQFFNENDGWITGFGVARTTDGGLHWEQQQIPDIPPNLVYNSLYFLDFDLGWIVGNDGTIIKTTEGQSSIQNKNATPGYFALHQNYPNPFNPSTTICFSLQKPEHITLKIFNLAGQEIVTLVDDVRSTGEHQVQWQPDGLPAGIYFYHIKTNHQILQKKMLLIQ